MRLLGLIKLITVIKVILENAKKKCAEGERWSPDNCVLRPECQPSCLNNWAQPRPGTCPGLCQPGGCICKKDFYRDNEANCIKSPNCNKPPHYPLGRK